MEPNSQSHENPVQPTQNNPVMDVVAPPAPVSDAKNTNPEQVSSDHQKKADKAAVPTKMPARVKQPKQPGNGIGLAITATVIIVLGLATLATYAYLKTVN